MKLLESVVLGAILLAALCSFAAQAEPLGNWDVYSLSGVKASYESGETISATVNYKLNNPSHCPACIQQIVVGLVDQQGNRVVVVPCIYSGIPKVEPNWTTGRESFSLTAPSTPGTYKLLAVNAYEYRCSAAQAKFPTQTRKKELATIRVRKQVPLVAEAGGPYSGIAGQPITFDGTGSQGPIVDYWWTFGDGTGARGAVVQHTYANPGTYTGILTVHAADRATGTDTAQVTVSRQAGDDGDAAQWNIDFQGDENHNNTYGQTDPVDYSEPGAHWNIFEVAALRAPWPTNYTTNPSIVLVDSEGAASGVTFSIIGDAYGWAGGCW